MKVHLARIAVVLTTLSSSVSSALAGNAAGGKAAGGHHTQMRRLTKEESTTSLSSLGSEHAGSDGNATSLLEKRSYGGQGTYFQPGQGACGWTASARDHIAALNSNQYGDMGQRSPHCGHWIWIRNKQTGARTRAQVQDACPGCQYGSLDLSPAAFDDLAPESQGVVQIEWDFE